MKKLSICLLLNLLSLAALAQVTVDPFFFTIDDEITLTVDLKEANDSRTQDLLGLTSGVYLWAGAGTNEDPFTYEPSAQNSFNQAVTGGEMTLVGDDVWTITLTPKTYLKSLMEKPSRPWGYC